eukprot:2688787-Alexandrium_andersonii.AAC.1
MCDSVCFYRQGPGGVPVGCCSGLWRPTDANPGVGRQLHGGCFTSSLQVGQATAADPDEPRVSLEE